jgi:murein DD-endopeptidase MepM/ murein hydrolase activator NlpD
MFSFLSRVCALFLFYAFSTGFAASEVIDKIPRTQLSATILDVEEPDRPCLPTQDQKPRSSRMFQHDRDSYEGDLAYLAVVWKRDVADCSFALAFVRYESDGLVADELVGYHYSERGGSNSTEFGRLPELKDAFRSPDFSFMVIETPLIFYLDALHFTREYLDWEFSQNGSQNESSESRTKRFALNVFGRSISHLRIDITNIIEQRSPRPGMAAGAILVDVYSFLPPGKLYLALDRARIFGFSYLPPYWKSEFNLRDYDEQIGLIEALRSDVIGRNQTPIGQLLNHDCVTSQTTSVDEKQEIDARCIADASVSLSENGRALPVLAVTGQKIGNTFDGRITVYDPGRTVTGFNNAFSKMQKMLNRLTPMERQELAVAARNASATGKPPPEAYEIVPISKDTTRLEFDDREELLDWSNYYEYGRTVVINSNTETNQSVLAFHNAQGVLVRITFSDESGAEQEQRLFDGDGFLVGTSSVGDQTGQIEFNLFKRVPYFDYPVHREVRGKITDAGVEFSENIVVPFTHTLESGDQLIARGDEYRLQSTNGSIISFQADYDFYSTEQTYPFRIRRGHVTLVSGGYHILANVRPRLDKHWFCFTGIRDIKKIDDKNVTINRKVENCDVYAGVKKDFWYYVEKPFRSIESWGCGLVTNTQLADNCSINIQTEINYTIENPFSEISAPMSAPANPGRSKQFVASSPPPEISAEAQSQGNLGEEFAATYSQFADLFTANGYFILETDESVLREMAANNYFALESDIHLMRDLASADGTPSDASDGSVVLPPYSWTRVLNRDLVEVYPDGYLASNADGGFEWPGSNGYYSPVTLTMEMRFDNHGDHWVGATRGCDKNGENCWNHFGTDLAAFPGDPIYAPVGGIAYIWQIPPRPSTGLVGVQIQKDGWKSKIAYLDEDSVARMGIENGVEVVPGQQIGNMGWIWSAYPNFGITSHVHWAIEMPNKDGQKRAFNPFCGIAVYGKDFTKPVPKWAQSTQKCPRVP